MAKFKIHMKKDASFSVNSAGNPTGTIDAMEKDVIVKCKYCTEAVVSASKSSYGFYPVKWECIEPDVKTPEEIAEEKENAKILEEWKKKNADKMKDDNVSDT